MSRIIVLILSISTLSLLAGCAASSRPAHRPEQVPLMQKYTTGPDAAGNASENEVFLARDDTLTMTEAIQLVLLKNPELQSRSFEIRAREADTRQQSFAPNPGVEFEVENFGGSGELSGFSGSDITITAGQLIELAGKREKRTRAAALKSDISVWDYEAKKLDVLTETVRQYVQLIGDQEKIRLDQELVDVSEQLFQAVHRLVEAGKISPAEISRTQILLTTAQLELNKSERKLAADRSRLAALWGDTSAGFSSVKGSLKKIRVLPPVDSLKKYLAENPDIIRWKAETDFRRAVEIVEETRRVPDPTFRAGYRYISGPGLNAFTAGLSIPVPVFDNNEGAVEEAFNRRKKAEEQRRQAEISLRSDLEQLYQNLLVLQTAADQSNKIIVPEAEKAYQIIHDGYLSGKFRFLDVLDAQRTLYETRKNLITSLTQYNIHLAELEKLIGRSLPATAK
jgi:cobalt-zinc-cadmium efflux system outer membrane protein